ncbi:hypothetical protein PBY51_020047 [Eleginops maclovinus]|uniref:Uncharacterized protein n=1 Tax=Eleginops maclovinus TaxID=56733 RepID=A0AAN7XR59_ELEMC|nr:hypothetical protein PBY51_020047 [Eleginops maclovinus]
MHDQKEGEVRVDLATISLQVGCGLERVRLVDFAFSLKHGVRKVENVVSLSVLVRVEDFCGSWRYGVSEGVRVLEPEEVVIC